MTRVYSAQGLEGVFSSEESAKGYIQELREGQGIDAWTGGRFKETWCSQCGKDLGPGDSGASHCEDHA